MKPAIQWNIYRVRFDYCAGKALTFYLLSRPMQSIFIVVYIYAERGQEGGEGNGKLRLATRRRQGVVGGWAMGRLSFPQGAHLSS